MIDFSLMPALSAAPPSVTSEKNQDSDDDSKEKPDQEEPDDQDNDVQDGEDDGSTDSLLRDFLENGMSYEHYHNVW